MTTPTHSKRFHGLAKHGLAVLATLLLGAVLVLWSWNTVVADLFAGPEAQYKHAIAMVALAALTGFLLRGPRRHGQKEISKTR